MNVNTRTEVLASIDSMNDVVQESEFGVLMSLLDQADKASVILENYNGDDLDMFSIYQEAEEATDDGDSEKKQTAVQQGAPSGQTSSNVAGNKENILQKLWNFIKNIISSVGNFFKKCWKNRPIVHVEPVEEPETKSLFEKIADKTPEWVKENGKALGVSSAAVLASLASIAAINQEMNKESVNLVKTLSSFGILAGSGIAVNSLYFSCRGDGIASSIVIPSVTNIMLSVLGWFTFFGSTEKTSNSIDFTFKTIEAFGKIKEEAKNVISNDNPPPVTSYEKIESDINAVKNKIEEGNFNLNENPVKDGDNQSEEAKKAKETGTAAGIIQKIGLAINKFFQIIQDKFKALKEHIANIRNNHGKTDETPEGETPTEGESEDSDATADGGVPDADAVANGEASTEDTSTETSTEGSETSNEPTPGDGKSYTLDEVAQFMKDKFNFDIAVADGKPTRGVVNRQGNNYGTIPAGKDNHRFRPTGDGNWVYEETEEAVDDGEEVVTESHSGYYWK